LKVFTPLTSLGDNKYLDCLWQSLKPFGVEVAALNIYQSFSRFKASILPGEVFHLHWVDTLCRIDSDRLFNSLLSILSNLRKLVYLKSQGFQIVWTVHNTLGHDCRHPIIERTFRFFIAHICTDIIVMSEHSRQEFARVYKRSKYVHTIPHGNYIGVYPNQVTAADSRHRLGIEPHLRVFLFLGAVKPYKGIPNLISAFEQIKDIDIRLLIAGSPKTPDLVAQIELAAQKDPRILTRLEFIPDQDIQLYMNACDWVVLPFQSILNSGSILLALSFGRPVIVPKIGAIPEFLVNGEHGYLYANDQELIHTLNRSLLTPHKRWQEMCFNSYTLAQKFDWSDIGHQIYQIYQRRNDKTCQAK
jgi:beta-1,4-mannosyltransferase